MGPSRARGLSSGPTQASGLLEAHEPRGHCTPLPPLSVALHAVVVNTAGLALADWYLILAQTCLLPK